MKNKKNSQDDKLKPLLPSLRTKKRFIKIKIISKKKLTFNEISKLLMSEFLFYLGAFEFGDSTTWLLKDKFNEKEQTIIIKVSTKTKNKVLAVLELINIKNPDVKFKTLKTSGTLKGLEK